MTLECKFSNILPLSDENIRVRKVKLERRGDMETRYIFLLVFNE